jgi:hypothetical protein
VVLRRAVVLKKTEHLFDRFCLIPVNLWANVVFGVQLLNKSMNKIVTSVGMLALGVSALHAAESSTLTPLQKTKPWSIQATLNGFYDDNVNGSPKGSELDSTGVEIIPAIRYGLPGEQTSFNVG